MTARRGLLFVVDEKTADELLNLRGDPGAALEFARREADDYFGQGALEPIYELDVTWDAIHRCLKGSAHLEGTLLGGRSLGDDEALLFFKSSEEVHEIAQALEWFTEDDLRGRYEALDCKGFSPAVEQEDWEYLWYYFAGLIEFYHFAAKEGLGVIFSTAGAPEAWATSLFQLGEGASGSITVSLDEDANLPPQKWWLNFDACPFALTLCVPGPGLPREVVKFIDEIRGDSQLDRDPACLHLGTVGDLQAKLLWGEEVGGGRFSLRVGPGDPADGLVDLALTDHLLENFIEAFRKLVDDIGLCEDLEAIVCGEG